MVIQMLLFVLLAALVVIVWIPSHAFAISVTEEQLEEWTALWWQWVMGNNKTNLLHDPTGSAIMKYQPADEDVFLLTGAYDANQTRNVTVPTGKTVLLPVYNGFRYCMNCNVLSSFNLYERLVKENEIMNASAYLEARLDDKLIPYHRITSPLFDLTLIKGNPIYLSDGVGMTFPAVSDGYWVALDAGSTDLPVGNHTLYTKGIAKHGYSTEVRYNVEVVPVS